MSLNETSAVYELIRENHCRFFLDLEVKRHVLVDEAAITMEMERLRWMQFTAEEAASVAVMYKEVIVLPWSVGMVKMAYLFFETVVIDFLEYVLGFKEERPVSNGDVLFMTGSTNEC